MHVDLQSVPSFPNYYGRSLDAWNDCLSDLPVPELGGVALVLRRFDSYSNGSGAALMHSGRMEAEVILDILAGTARYFLVFGRRCVTLVQTDDPKARFERLACVSPQ
jgi:hypothetical protein